MTLDPLPVRIPALVVQLALALFLVSEVLFVPLHHRIVLGASRIDLVGKLTVLLGDADLLLQPLLLVVQLAESVFHHLGLDLLLLEVELLLELA